MATSNFELTSLAPTRNLVLAVVTLSCFVSLRSAYAETSLVGVFQRTHLIGVSKGSSLSDLAKVLGDGGFETAEGKKVRLT